MRKAAFLRLKKVLAEKTTQELINRLNELEAEKSYLNHDVRICIRKILIERGV